MRLYPCTNHNNLNIEKRWVDRGRAYSSFTPKRRVVGVKEELVDVPNIEILTAIDQRKSQTDDRFPARAFDALLHPPDVRLVQISELRDRVQGFSGFYTEPV